MLISGLNPNTLTNEQMTALLFQGIADDGRKGDCIFVFGSKGSLKFRVPKAVELYKAGRAGKILFSGGKVWEGQGEPEAVVMRQGAMQRGVPAEACLIETDSKHTKENVLASLLILDRAFMLHSIRRLLIVTTTYHMKRCYLTLKQYMPAWIEYSLCPVDDLTTKADNWWLHESGRNLVNIESRKMIRYVKSGAIADDVFP